MLISAVSVHRLTVVSQCRCAARILHSLLQVHTYASLVLRAYSPVKLFVAVQTFPGPEL